GGRRRELVIGGCRKQRRKIGCRPAAARNVEHGPDEKPYHVMEKAVRFDLEHESTRLVAPPRFGHRTAMLVVRRRRASHGERAKAVLPFDARGGRIERTPVERMVERQLVPGAKGRAGVVISADVVVV